MALIVFFRKIFANLIRLPLFFAYQIHDRFLYYKYKRYKDFDRWGIHIFTSKFGAGKTSSMVYTAYKLCKRFPQVQVLSNIKLSGFPDHTVIKPLDSVDDIFSCADNTIILIDEIGTILNSRDFCNGKSMSKALFQYFCQVRHRHVVLFGTSQRWHFVDKQIRDVATTVRVCSSYFPHPFTRCVNVTYYDAQDYDLSYSNPMISLAPIDCITYLQSDKLRQMYDTTEMVQTILHSDYFDTDDDDNRSSVAVSDRKTSRRFKRGVGRLG